MKRLAIILCLALAAMSAGAQPGPFRPEMMNDEKFIQMQAMDIADWLDLEENIQDKFVDTYSAFKKEINAIAKKAQPSKAPQKESEIEEAIQKNFEISESILQVRKKYYQRFKKFMKPSQIQMMYRIENEAGRRMHGFPGGPPPEPGFGGRPEF